MKNRSSFKFNNYLVAALIMILGLIYNVVEQDFVGAGVFLISAVVFFSLGIIKKRSATKEDLAS